MPYDFSLQKLLPFKDNLTIFKESNIFIVNMNFHDSNSSYRETYIMVKCLWILIQ